MKLVNIIKTTGMVAALLSGASFTALTNAQAYEDNGIRYGNERGYGKQRIVVQMYDQHLRGQNVLKLKQLVRQQTGMRMKGQKLIRVKLVAKTRQGRGTATLTIAHMNQDQSRVGGSPQDFYSNAGYTYDRIFLSPRAYNTQGAWQIQLRGNFKVKKIIVVIEDNNRRGGNGRLRDITLGTGRAGNYQSERQSFYIQYGLRVQAVKIKALQGNMIIERAVAVMENGQRQMLRGLLGQIRAGEQLQARVRRINGRISQVIIRARTLNGSRYNGVYKVLVR